MQQALNSKDGIANGWVGAGFAGAADARNMPDVKHAAAREAATSAAGDAADGAQQKRGGLLGTTLRLVRNAAIGLALISAIPVGIVAWRSQYLRYYDVERSAQRIARVERYRPLMAPKDASITPMQAGQAFFALQGTKTNEQLPGARLAETAAAWPWRTNKLTDGMFAAAGPRVPAFAGAPPEHIVESARAGFSTTELAWLRAVAESPVWKPFDLVAAANAVDFVGARNRASIGANPLVAQMAGVRFATMKELAYAGMSRAAYYLAIGETQKSEAALRSVVSFGFALIDNANTIMESLIGGVIVNIGRDGLEQFATATNTPNELARVAPPTGTQQVDPLNRGRRMSAAELSQQLLRTATDKSLPRGVRIEQLNQLSIASCRSVAGMFSGPGSETQAAFDEARRTLARFPSEVALLDAMEDATNHIPEKERITFGPERFLMGAAVVASTVTNNPRIVGCTRIAVSLSYW